MFVQTNRRTIYTYFWGFHHRDAISPAIGQMCWQTIIASGNHVVNIELICARLR